MDSQNSIYSEKKLAYYEASFKANMIAKPQEVNLTLTAAHIYGLGYIYDQTGTKESDPIYSRFSCSLDEITKIYINENVKTSPLYIQCDESSKGITNRRRIIIPCLDNVAQIVEEITNAKAEYDQKLEKQKQHEKERKLKDIEQTKGKTEESISQSDDPASHVAEFLSNLSASKEEQPPVKKSVLPELKNDFDFSPADFSDSNSSNDKIEAVSVETISIDKQESIPVTIPVKEDHFDIDDAISEILDNLSAEIDLNKSIGKNDGQIDEQAYDEIEAVSLEDIGEIPEVPKVTEVAKTPEVAEVPKVPQVSYKENTVSEIQSAAVIEKPAFSKADIESPKKEMSLEEFEKAVKKLRTMLDANAISEEEFICEKKKLIENLY
jgi:hypothetical protein